MELVNRELIINTLTHEAPWASSHAAERMYLGVGLRYYALVYIPRAQVAVGLGSGGGFVPRLMREVEGCAATWRRINATRWRATKWAT